MVRASCLRDCYSDGIFKPRQAWRCYVVWKHSKAVGVVLVSEFYGMSARTQLTRLQTLLLVAFFGGEHALVTESHADGLL